MTLEELAQQAQALTLKHFGRTILFFTPLYLNNECDNHCVYCGFSKTRSGVTLSVEEVETEANRLFERGFRHLLLVCGEKRDKITMPYLKEIIIRLHRKFASISLEIFPLEEKEYRELHHAGADGLTIYQETYDRELYRKYHPAGSKSDYDFRFQAPERAARAGFYRINIGALLGLAPWRQEAAALVWHAQHLKKAFWQTQAAISFPRLKPSSAHFSPPYPVSDRELVEMICSLRVSLPTVGMSLSTRERPELRDHLIPLGITQMSAESNTLEQFEISDRRSVREVASAVAAKGYEPVYKDWDRSYII